METPSCPTGDCPERPTPLAVHGNIEASEWYFRKCHRSLPMDRELAFHLLTMEDERRKAS